METSSIAVRTELHAVPHDILRVITSFLSYSDIASLSHTCQRYHQLLSCEAFWYYYFCVTYPHLRKHVPSTVESWRAIIAQPKFEMGFLTWNNTYVETMFKIPITRQDRIFSGDVFGMVHMHYYDWYKIVPILSLRRVIDYRLHASGRFNLLYIDNEHNLYFYIERKNENRLIRNEVRCADYCLSANKYAVARMDNSVWICNALSFSSPGVWCVLDIVLPCPIVEVVLFDRYLHLLTSSHWMYVYFIEDNQAHFIRKRSGVLAMTEFNNLIYIFTEQGHIRSTYLMRDIFVGARKRQRLDDRYYLRCSHDRLLTLYDFLSYRSHERSVFLKMR